MFLYDTRSSLESRIDVITVEKCQYSVIDLCARSAHERRCANKRRAAIDIDAIIRFECAAQFHRNHRMASDILFAGSLGALVAITFVIFGGASASSI